MNSPSCFCSYTSYRGTLSGHVPMHTHCCGGKPMHLTEKIFQFGSLSLATLPDTGLKKGKSDSESSLHYPDLCDAWVFALHIPQSSIKTKKTTVDLVKPITYGFPSSETKGVKGRYNLQEVSFVLLCRISFDLVPDKLPCVHFGGKKTKHAKEKEQKDLRRIFFPLISGEKCCLCLFRGKQTPCSCYWD